MQFVVLSNGLSCHTQMSTSVSASFLANLVRQDAYWWQITCLSPTNPFAPMAETQPKDLAFEEALGRLEEIVETLEEDPPALEEALAAYEEGVELAHACLKRLHAAELRVEELALDEERLSADL